MAGRVKLFGIGLNKTGTTSLRLALQHLGFRHHAPDRGLMKDYAAGELKSILAAAESHDSFEDWPWPLVWRQMDAHFGARARFVLTRRISPAAWLGSLKKHAERSRAGGRLRRIAYGAAYPHGHEDAFLAAYERHNAEIRTHFAHPERAARFTELCWEEGHGWPELCRLLGEPVPDIPFPHANAGTAASPDPEVLARNRRRIRRRLRRERT